MTSPPKEENMKKLTIPENDHHQQDEEEEGKPVAANSSAAGACAGAGGSRKVETLPHYQQCLFSDLSDPNATRVKKPSDNDILFGRGRRFQEHHGNKRMLSLIESRRQHYQNQPRNKKRQTVESLYDEISQGGARFLKYLDEENVWVEVNIPIALEKIFHTLRSKRRNEKKSRAAGNDKNNTAFTTMKGNNSRLPSAAAAAAGTGITGVLRGDNLVPLPSTSTSTSIKSLLSSLSSQQEQQQQQAVRSLLVDTIAVAAARNSTFDRLNTGACLFAPPFSSSSFATIPTDATNSIQQQQQQLALFLQQPSLLSSLSPDAAALRFHMLLRQNQQNQQQQQAALLLQLQLQQKLLQQQQTQQQEQSPAFGDGERDGFVLEQQQKRREKIKRLFKESIP